MIDLKEMGKLITALSEAEKVNNDLFEQIISGNEKLAKAIEKTSNVFKSRFNIERSNELAFAYIKRDFDQNMLNKYDVFLVNLPKEDKRLEIIIWKLNFYRQLNQCYEIELGLNKKK